MLDQHWDLLEHWDISIAIERAQQLQLPWSQELLEWVQTTRQFYIAFDHSPSVRALVKYLKANLARPPTNLELQKRFPCNPALALTYLAGIPRPKHCF